MAGYIEDYLKKSGLIESIEVQEALTHKSADSRHYEKLEFLGDSILGLAVSEHLFVEFQDMDVGVMAKIKGYLVSRDVLFKIGRSNNIIKMMKSGSALSKREIKDNKKIISDVIESIIGAVYLARGLEAARDFINNIYRQEYKAAKNRKDFGDYKSELQIKLLAAYNTLPEYNVVRTEGKEHRKTFHVEAVYGGRALGRGKGRTIKEAEQAAAKQALGRIPREAKK
jgi:ribonuclease-3